MSERGTRARDRLAELGAGGSTRALVAGAWCVVRRARGEDEGGGRTARLSRGKSARASSQKAGDAVRGGGETECPSPTSPRANCRKRLRDKRTDLSAFGRSKVASRPLDALLTLARSSVAISSYAFSCCRATPAASEGDRRARPVDHDHLRILARASSLPRPDLQLGLDSLCTSTIESAARCTRDDLRLASEADARARAAGSWSGVRARTERPARPRIGTLREWCRTVHYERRDEARAALIRRGGRMRRMSQVGRERARSDRRAGDGVDDAAARAPENRPACTVDV